MILLRRWQRYVRYLAAVACLIVLVTLVKQADLGDGADYDEYYEYKSSGRRGGARLEKLTVHGKAGEGGDRQWLPGFKRRGWIKALPVVVLEEHYEVLQYWFQAADLGLISKSKNTLIHIGAQSDLELPEMTSSMPWFHYPETKKEIRSLMQENDRLIVAAAQAGLVDHIVWVMPPWSKDKTFPRPANIWFKFGTLMRRAPGNHKQNFCSCWVHFPLASTERKHTREKGWGDNWPSEDNNGWRCQANEFTPLAEDDSGSDINPAQCSVHQSGLLQLVDQTEAPSVLASLSQDGGQYGHTHGVLLDINEDYFGLWSDTFDLNSLGLNPDESDILSGLVGELYCADTTFDERIADMFHAALINLLVNIKLQSCEIKGEQFVPNQRRRTCYTSLEMSNLLIEKIPKMIRFLVEVGEAEHILCTRSEPSPNSPVATQLQNLVLYLQNLSVNQLRHLAWLGICFDVPPRSAYFKYPRPLTLCQGQSKPNQTTIPFYHPSEGDLETNPEDFRKLLSSYESKPSLVTVSRSVRSGFTPKDSFHSIEALVLDSLKSVYKSSLRVESIHFDSNLLGGKLGWPRRFPSWNNKLLNFLSVEVVADHYKGT